MADTIRAGDRFGALTVIDIDNRPHRTSSWLCRCDCGQEAYFYTSRLLNGSAKSCGCKNHTDRNQQTDLTGKRFGHLLVIARSDNPRRKSKWLCRCDCGNTLEIHASGLIKGRRTSCGCSHHSSKYHHEDFTGRRFGHMTVIARSTDPKNKAMLNNSDVESHPICWREPARNSLGKFESARQSHPCGVDNPALTSLVQ